MGEISYDYGADVLYVGISDRSNSYGAEEDNGFIVLRDIDTDEVTGITILDFFETLKGAR